MRVRLFVRRSWRARAAATAAIALPVATVVASAMVFLRLDLPGAAAVASVGALASVGACLRWATAADALLAVALAGVTLVVLFASGEVGRRVSCGGDVLDYELAWLGATTLGFAAGSAASHRRSVPVWLATALVVGAVCAIASIAVTVPCSPDR